MYRFKTTVCESLYLLFTKAPVSLTSVFKDLLFSQLRESRLLQTEFSIYLVEQLLLQFASRIQ